jgi:hypothetical protein
VPYSEPGRHAAVVRAVGMGCIPAVLRFKLGIIRYVRQCVAAATKYVTRCGPFQSKSFLVLFFKKELLSSFLLANEHYVDWT